ncbi:hypothetical protein GEMRC1_007836 [Eukaryota sp. GEM-RC1]
MVNIGCCYYWRKGVSNFRKFLGEASNWFKKAADFNNSEGIFLLASCYKHGHAVKQSIDKSINLLKIAIELDNTGAMNFLGELYETGEGVDEDVDEAIRYYQMAAEGGSSTGMMNLGLQFMNKIEVEQNYQMAFELFPKVGS